MIFASICLHVCSKVRTTACTFVPKLTPHQVLYVLDRSMLINTSGAIEHALSRKSGVGVSDMRFALSLVQAVELLPPLFGGVYLHYIIFCI